MPKSNLPLLSVIVPVYNEAAGIARFHTMLLSVLQTEALRYEVIYVDDGSVDNSAAIIRSFCSEDTHIRLVKFSRNFGKESATTAGIHSARGDAIIMLDADGQHPVTAIPKFVTKWQHGAKVVVGVRTGRNASLAKRLGSKLFYKLFRLLTGITLDADSSNFCLIDKTVQAEFNRMTERNRITRGLIGWLGYERAHVTYDENQRLAGDAPYSLNKLFKLAIDSLISFSRSPLYLVAYIGAVVLPLSTVLGLGMLINFVLGDPLHVHATAGAYLIVLILFLIGVLLVSQGIIGLYLSHIHAETQNRPLYVIDEANSERLQ